jgi:hypothetical protein
VGLQVAKPDTGGAVSQIRPSGTACEKAKVTIRLEAMGEGPVEDGGCRVAIELHAGVGAETYSRKRCVTLPH